MRTSRKPSPVTDSSTTSLPEDPQIVNRPLAASNVVITLDPSDVGDDVENWNEAAVNALFLARGGALALRVETTAGALGKLRDVGVRGLIPGSLAANRAAIRDAAGGPLATDTD